MAKQKIDVFPNRAIQRLTLSAANTLTFAQMRFGTGLFGGSALVISLIEWFVDIATFAMAATGDVSRFALTNRDDLTSLDADQMNVLVRAEWISIVGGAPASAQSALNPLRSDFSNLPGGGLIVPANPLFLGGNTISIAGVMTVDMVMYYTVKQLADADYIELIQSLIPVNI